MTDDDVDQVGEPADIAEPDGVHRDSPRSGLFDRQGHPITLDQWVAYTNDPEYWIIVRDIITDPDGIEYLVSTIWLGTNRNMLNPDDRPSGLFETMAFDPDGRSYGEQRHNTEHEARQWHEKLTIALRERGATRLGLTALADEDDGR